MATASKASERQKSAPPRSSGAPRIPMLSLVRMLWKQKIYMLLIWVVITGGGAVVVMRLKPTYRAETLILVDSQKIPDKYVSTTVVSDVQDRLATLNQEILSSTRLKKIIDDFNLYEEDKKKKT